MKFARSTEQSGYEVVRSFARQNNLDMKLCDSLLDRTIWIWDFAIIRENNLDIFRCDKSLVGQKKPGNVDVFMFCFFTWGHYWTLCGYIVGNIGY